MGYLFGVPSSLGTPIPSPCLGLELDPRNFVSLLFEEKQTGQAGWGRPGVRGSAGVLL